MNGIQLFDQIIDEFVSAVSYLEELGVFDVTPEKTLTPITTEKLHRLPDREWTTECERIGIAGNCCGDCSICPAGSTKKW